MRNKRDCEMRRLQDFNRDLKGEGPPVSPSPWVLSVPQLFQWETRLFPLPPAQILYSNLNWVWLFWTRAVGIGEQAAGQQDPGIPGEQPGQRGQTPGTE